MTKKYLQDGGHGGSDPGAHAFGQNEKEWTLEAAYYVDKRLGELGVWSKMTRTKDETMESVERTNIVKRSGADVCFSHHFNAAGGQGYGIETIHSIYASSKLAQMIADELHKVTGFPIRRVFDRKGKSGDYYYMHRMTGSVETVIIEYGFLDDEKTYNKFKSKSYREMMYEAVVKVACEYAGAKYKAPAAPKPKAAAKSSGSLYKVQAGAFSTKEAAETHAKKIEKAGFSTFIVKE